MADQLPLLGVILILGALQCPASILGHRLPREVNAPAEINCKYTSWHNWSECDPCTREKYRSRSISKFGQFGGESCQSNLGAFTSCQTTEVCEDKLIDCGNDFQCDSGRCINKRMKCNLDNDCGDNSDEVDCEEGKSPCKRDDLEVSEVARTAGTGVNILGVKANANAFDSEFFNGLCSRVYDGNTRTSYRTPWNTAAVNYQTQADKSFTSETFSDSSSVVIKIMKEKTNKIEGEASFKIKPTEILKKKKSGGKGTDGAEGGDGDTGEGFQLEKDLSIGVEAGIDKSWEDSVTTLKELTKTTHKEFLRIHGTTQLANFQMRTRGTVMSTTFIDDVNALPPFYEKTPYFAFLETYGTHYTISGSVGGKFDLVYVLDKNELEKKDMTTKDVKDCLGFNVGLNIDSAVGEGKIGVKNPKCQNFNVETTESGGKTGGIEKAVSFVQGGTVEFATKLNQKLRKNENVDFEDYAEWARSIVDAPAVIKAKNSPIHTIIPSTLKDAYIKQQNLQQAIQDYIDEYSTCKCEACKNGGTVVVIDGSCLCQCSDNYEGVACQTVKSSAIDVKPYTGIDGRWSCWKDSSGCVNNEKSQTRECNNPAPQNGGKPCGGERSRNVFCLE